jgi:DNA-directed RNA polymerase I, II, and III subunit RPABC1
LKHNLVPTHTVLSSEEKEEFIKKYNITSSKMIPTISYFSPVSLVLGIRPGDVCKIERFSKTSIDSNFYRICIL